MDESEFKDVDYCEYGFNFRKSTRLWNSITTWKPRDLCKKDCGNIRNNKHIEAAQRLPSGNKETWGDNGEFDGLRILSLGLGLKLEISRFIQRQHSKKMEFSAIENDRLYML